MGIGILKAKIDLGVERAGEHGGSGIHCLLSGNLGEGSIGSNGVCALGCGCLNVGGRHDFSSHDSRNNVVGSVTFQELEVSLCISFKAGTSEGCQVIFDFMAQGLGIEENVKKLGGFTVGHNVDRLGLESVLGI